MNEFDPEAVMNELVELNWLAAVDKMNRLGIGLEEALAMQMEEISKGSKDE